jgi:hypothetical protein
VSALRYLVSLCLVFAGFVLVLGGRGLGPCGSSSFSTTTAPFQEFLVAALGLELIGGSYFLVKQLRHEGNFRTMVYVLLIMSALGLPSAMFDVVHWGELWKSPEIAYMALLGLLALINLVVFYQLVGVEPSPRGKAGTGEGANAFVRSLTIWEALVLGPILALVSLKLVELEGWLPFIWLFVLGPVCVGTVFLVSRRAKGALLVVTAIVVGSLVMLAGGTVIANVIGGFEESTALFATGVLVSVPSAIACAIIARREAARLC